MPQGDAAPLVSGGGRAQDQQDLALRGLVLLAQFQAVTVKVESFPYTRYGYLTGKAVSVSHDAMQDENLGLVFPARVKLEQATLNIDGVSVRLSTGMSLSAEIKTGKRRVIDYLLSPLQQHTTESMRER